MDLLDVGHASTYIICFPLCFIAWNHATTHVTSFEMSVECSKSYKLDQDSNGETERLGENIQQCAFEAFAVLTKSTKNTSSEIINISGT